MKDRQFVNALARGLELLKCFNLNDQYVGVSELARRTGIPKPTVSRLAGTLSKLGYLEYSDSLGKYSLGIGVLALGHAKIANLDVRSAARPLMEELAEYSQISVSIGMRHELSMIYVDTVRSSAPISLQRGIGARLPIGTTSIGRAYICGASDEERNEIFEGLQAKNKEDWVKIRDGIREALEDYAKYGFCISIGDWVSDIWAVGVPYKSPDGKLLSFNCGGPAFMLKEERLRNDIGPRLLEMVNKIKTIYK